MSIKNIFNKILNPWKRYVLNKRNHCNVNSNRASLQAKYGYSVRVDKNSYVNDHCTIDDYSYVNTGSSIENAQIGKYCSISSGVYIGPYEHGLNYISTSPKLQPTTKLKGVVIGNDVLISLNAIILDGVKIGDGAVVGAGAIVTHDVQPYEIVGGVPAKHIRFRFDEKTIIRLVDSEWYNLTEKQIKEIEEKVLGSLKPR